MLTLLKAKNVFGEEPLIMPNFNHKFTLAKNNKIESLKFYLNTSKIRKSKLNKIDTAIYNFKTEILNC
jgi:hypothetical protein